MKTIKKISKINLSYLKKYLINIYNFNYLYLLKENVLTLIETNIFVLVNFIKNNSLIFMQNNYDKIIDEYLLSILQSQLFS